MIPFIVRNYEAHILDPGKQPLFLLLVGFIVSFLCIRFSVRMIRRGVRWWPGNVKPGGLHIHHMVFGMGFLLVSGVGGFAIHGDATGWRDLCAFFFGVGCGLVLDEFALILHLEDVYWSEQGRKSVDAVILGILIVAVLLVGNFPLGARPPDGGRWALIGVLSATAVLSTVTLLKGKTWTGLIGIFVPLLALIGAVRLARPGSPWARWRYTSRPRRLARAQRRDNRVHRRVERARTWLFDLIAGAPERSTVLSKSPKLRQATDRLAQRVAPQHGDDAGAAAAPGAEPAVEPLAEVDGPWLDRLEHFREDLRVEHAETRRRRTMRRQARRLRRGHRPRRPPAG